MTRIDHFNDPDAPRPTRVVPAASAVITDDDGRLLLAKRTDNDAVDHPRRHDEAR